MEWAAYEQVYGSILPHERIDAGFAMLALILAKANGDNRSTMRTFMPPWYQELTREAELERGMQTLRLLVNDADD